MDGTYSKSRIRRWTQFCLGSLCLVVTIAALIGLARREKIHDLWLHWRYRHCLEAATGSASYPDIPPNAVPPSRSGQD